MKFDIHTLAIIQSLASFFQVIILFDNYLADKTNKGVAWWTLGSFFIASGFTIVHLRATPSPSLGLFMIVINNALFVSGMSCIYVGVLRFFDQDVRRGFLIIFCAVIVLIAVHFSYIDNDLAFRRVNISIATAVFSFLTARTLFMHRESAFYYTWFLFVIFIIYGSFFTFRSLTPFAGNVGHLFTPSLIQVSTYLISIISSTLWTFGFLFLANQHMGIKNKNSGVLSGNDDNQHPILKEHVIVILIYLVLAVITQSFFKTITVWPSAGLVLAAFLIFGVHIWPAIAVGTFLGVIAYFLQINEAPFSALHLIINLTTVIGNTAAGVIAMRVCGRVDSMAGSLSSFKWLFNNFFPAVCVLGLVSAIPGVGAYWLIGQPWEAGYFSGVAGWVISNVVGALVIAPLLLCLRLKGLTWRPLHDLKPHVLATVSLLFLTVMLFGPGELLLPPVFHQASFLLIPLVFVGYPLKLGCPSRNLYFVHNLDSIT